MKIHENEIIQWDVTNWSKALHFWEDAVDWTKVETCLELGGRQGGLSLWLASKGEKVVCSDLKDVRSTAEILHKKYNLDYAIEYRDIDASDIPYENHFDLIVFKSIIGGIGRNDNKEIQRKVFEQIHKALKPGGKLIFAENLTASPLHQFLRKKINKWSSYWRYITLNECKEFLKGYSSFELYTNGVLGTFGRSEKQKGLLAKVDNILFEKITPENWKYIVYGIAEK